jgi:hypothetical protein
MAGQGRSSFPPSSRRSEISGFFIWNSELQKYEDFFLHGSVVRTVKAERTYRNGGGQCWCKSIWGLQQCAGSSKDAHRFIGM